MNDKTQHPNNDPLKNIGSTADKQRGFISRSHQLAQWFTEPAWHNPNRAGKYLENGLKPIEAFCSDIQQNLIQWTSEDGVVFYRTEEFTYMFQTVPAYKIFHSSEGYTLSGDIVWMTRYRNGTWQRLDDWANPHSVEYLGAEFLETHSDKRVPLFNTGESL